MQRILFVLVGVLIVAAAAVTAFFVLRAPPSEEIGAPAPVEGISPPVTPASR